VLYIECASACRIHSHTDVATAVTAIVATAVVTGVATAVVTDFANVFVETIDLIVQTNKIFHKFFTEDYNIYINCSECCNWALVYL